MDDQALLGQPLGDVGVAEMVADVSADRRGDHVVVEAALGEGTGRASGEPAPTLVAAPALPAQAGPPVPPGSPATALDARHRPPLFRLISSRRCIAHPAATEPIVGPR